MGTVSRHAGSPFVDGETLSGTDLETDISNLVNEVNGNLDNSNIVSGADIDGTKLADNTVTNAKIGGNQLTTAKMNASAVPKHAVSESSSTAAMTTATAFADIAGFTDATLTPGSTNDMIFCDLTVHGVNDGANLDIFRFGFSVNGTDSNEVGRMRFVSNPESASVSWATSAPATTSMVIKPRYYKSSGSGAPTFFHGSSGARGVFRCWILPGK